jgi:PleD family two-component response regulator
VHNVIHARGLVSQAIAIAEQMRISVSDLKIPHTGSKAANHVTLSIEVCSLIPQPDRADRDLIA